VFAYVGSRTTRERNARGDGISVYRFDAADGTLSLVQVLGDLINPSFLLRHPTLDVLYTVHGDQDSVSGFRVDGDNGTLSFLNRQSCQGKNPVHLSLAPGGRHLVVSNHLTGTLALMPLAADGALEPVSQMLTLEGTLGPHRTEQPFAKPHFNPWDPSGRCMLVPDKGLDKVFAFHFEQGRLVPAAEPFVTCREGSGPRHLAFHPMRPWVYVINELDNTVAAYALNAATGRLTPFQIVSSLSEQYTGNSRASEIEVSRDGRHLFASNRGEDSIAVWTIDLTSGQLSARHTVPAEGKTPRFFTTDPSGRWMFVLNEDSDCIVGFDVAHSSIALRPRGMTYACGSPVCLVFSESRKPS
jgi:6-phosphogluconolactonase